MTINFGDFEMGKRIYMSWQTKERNNDKRVNFYSKPGVSEVIFGNEWKKGGRRPASENYEGKKTGNTVAFIFILIIIIAILVVFIPSPSNTPSNIDIPLSEPTSPFVEERAEDTILESLRSITNPDLIRNKPSIDIAELESRIHVLINEKRKNNGVSSLSLDDKLASIARIHSLDMSINNYFEHDNT